MRTLSLLIAIAILTLSIAAPAQQPCATDHQTVTVFFEMPESGWADYHLLR